MITLPSLYAHQTDQKDRTRAALARHGRVILNAPTGCGKTRMSKWILGSSANREPNERQSGKSLFTVHRRGLVQNAVDSFCEDPELPHGVIMSGMETAYGKRIQVASIDTLLSWFVEGNDYQTNMTFDLIVWDEAHSHHPKFAKFLKHHDQARKALKLHPAYVIGLTATPQAKGLSDVYQEIVQGPPTRWLIENGYLSPFRYFRATEGKLGLLVQRGGDFTKASVCAAMDGMAGDLVRDWKKYAEGRPTLGFFPRRSHARDAQAELQEAGLRVEYVDGETDDDKRQLLYRWLNNGDIDYLCNVQVVERGTDIPGIQCVQLCVATRSIVSWRQRIGRGSRVHPGKTDCIVLDHGGNLKRLNNFFEDDPDWSLDVTTKEPADRAPRPVIECPKCKGVYRGGLCRNCGYEPTPRERRAQGLTFDGSELQEVKREDKPNVKTAEDLMVSALYRAGRSGRTWRQCVGIFKRMCQQQGTPHHVPRFVNVQGHRYEMLRYGSDEGHLRVSSLYPFTVTPGEHSGKYLCEPQEAVGEPY